MSISLSTTVVHVIPALTLAQDEAQRHYSSAAGD
jgi:hypothetical protein